MKKWPTTDGWSYHDTLFGDWLDLLHIAQFKWQSLWPQLNSSSLQLASLAASQVAANCCSSKDVQRAEGRLAACSARDSLTDGSLPRAGVAQPDTIIDGIWLLDASGALVCVDLAVCKDFTWSVCRV